MEDQLRDLLAREAVIDTINRLFIRTDERDWPAVIDCFAPEVLFEIRADTGVEPTTLTPDLIVGGWEMGLRHLEAIHHQVGNHVVSVRGGQQDAPVAADAFCYGIASHYRTTRSGNNTRVYVGSYDFHLVEAEGGWKIDRFRFNLKYIDGNQNLDTDE